MRPLDTGDGEHRHVLGVSHLGVTLCHDTTQAGHNIGTCVTCPGEHGTWKGLDTTGHADSFAYVCSNFGLTDIVVNYGSMFYSETEKMQVGKSL